MRVKHTTIYTYNELSDSAKERAIAWYREGYLDYDWWDYLYEDFAQRAQELGIDLRQKPITLMNGKTRYDPEIYFSGFYHQGSGSAFSGTWKAWEMNLNKLKSECPTDKELHRIGDVLASYAKEDDQATATIRANRTNWIDVSMKGGNTLTEQLNELDFDSQEYRQLNQAFTNREEAITEAIRDFNRWIYKQLKTEYEYLTSDEQIEVALQANEYEFTEDGHIA